MTSRLLFSFIIFANTDQYITTILILRQEYCKQFGAHLLDSKLHYKFHIQMIKTKAAKDVNILSNLRFVFPKPTDSSFIMH